MCLDQHYLEVHAFQYRIKCISSAKKIQTYSLRSILVDMGLSKYRYIQIYFTSRYIDVWINSCQLIQNGGSRRQAWKDYSLLIQISHGLSGHVVLFQSPQTIQHQFDLRPAIVRLGKQEHTEIQFANFQLTNKMKVAMPTHQCKKLMVDEHKQQSGTIK